MNFLKNDYYEKSLLVNLTRTKTDKETGEVYTSIHINFVDDRRVNAWIKITDNMHIFDEDGNEVAWSIIDEDNLFQIVFKIPTRAKMCDKPYIRADIVRRFF